jgi:hypothetical protein
MKFLDGHELESCHPRTPTSFFQKKARPPPRRPAGRAAVQERVRNWAFPGSSAHAAPCLVRILGRGYPPCNTSSFIVYRSPCIVYTPDPMNDEQVSTDASVISFRCPPQLRAKIEQQAQAEGLTNSAVVRRAAMREFAAQEPNRPTAWAGLTTVMSGHKNKKNRNARPSR